MLVHKRPFVYSYIAVPWMPFKTSISIVIWTSGDSLKITDSIAELDTRLQNKCLWEEFIVSLRCVYIYIRQLSSFRAPTLWFIDLTVAILFTRKRTKHENSRSPPFSKMAADVNTGAQSINTEINSFVLSSGPRAAFCQSNPALWVYQRRLQQTQTGRM